jgi:hypothetical protein
MFVSSYTGPCRAASMCFHAEEAGRGGCRGSAFSGSGVTSRGSEAEVLLISSRPPWQKMISEIPPWTAGYVNFGRRRPGTNPTASEKALKDPVRDARCKTVSRPRICLSEDCQAD